MTKSEFFLDNLIDLFDETGIVLRYNGNIDMSLRDILDYNSDISLSEKKELFISGIDLLEARSLLKVLGSENASIINRVDVKRLREVFQGFRDLLDELLSESGVLRDYRPQFEIINKLRASNLKVLEGGK